MKKWLPIVILVVVVAALVIISLSRRDNSPRVDASVVERRDLTAVVSASGTVQPQKSVDVSANVMGTITHLAVAEGERVTQGDLLLEIDPTEYRSAVEALEAAVLSGRADVKLAEASLDKARQDHARQAELFAEGLSSEEQLIAARTNLKVEEARVDAARHRLTQTLANLQKARHDLGKVTIAAPMTGLVTRLNVEEGENAIMGTLNNPGTVLLVIADMGTLEAVVEVDETEVVQVRLGQPAVVEIDAFPGRGVSGPRLRDRQQPHPGRRQPAGRRLRGQGGARQAPDTIRPGLTAKARITVAERGQAVAVPLGAVTARDWPLQQDQIAELKGGEAGARDEALADLGFTPRRRRMRSSARNARACSWSARGSSSSCPWSWASPARSTSRSSRGLAAGEHVVSGPFRVLRELKDGAPVRESGDGVGRRTD